MAAQQIDDWVSAPPEELAREIIRLQAQLTTLRGERSFWIAQANHPLPVNGTPPRRPLPPLCALFWWNHLIAPVYLAASFTGVAAA